MELKKGKYKQAEVRLLLDACKTEYQDKIDQLKDDLISLSEENKKLSAQLEIYKNDEKLIVSTLKNAEKRAKEIESISLSNYLATLETLKNFASRWNEYFNYLLEKYPYYPAVKQVAELKEKVSLIIGMSDEKHTFEQVKTEFDKINNDNTFNPKNKINDYVVATSDNGFNLDEVLNPGALRLEDLCKELGLLDEND